VFSVGLKAVGRRGELLEIPGESSQVPEQEKLQDTVESGWLKKRLSV